MCRIVRYTVKRVKESSVLCNVDRKVDSPEKANDIIKLVLDLNNEAVEKFGIITLDVKCQAIGIHIISVGSLNASIVHPREVFQHAILSSAASIICFHNHPSGDPEPSSEDMGLTDRLVEAGKIMGIKVVDHIIVGEDRYYSMNEYGKIK